MAGVRGTKRRLDLGSGSLGPADTSTTELTFKTAQERTLPAMSGMADDNDLTEVSSPARPTAVSKIKRQVEWLREEAATFAKAKNVFRAMQATSPPKAGPSQREVRAQLRAERIKQGEASGSLVDRGREEADMTELEAAASLVDLMAHERLQPDRACTAAWAKMYGPGSSSPAQRLAPDWSTQHASSPNIQANMQAVAGTPIGSLHQHRSVPESAVPASPAGVQAEPSLAELTWPQLGTVATAATGGTYAAPVEGYVMQIAAEYDEVEAVQQHGASASSLHGRQQPASVIPQNLTQQPAKEQAAAVTTSLSPAAPQFAKRQAESAAVASPMQGTPSSARKAARMTSPGSPTNSGLAGLVPSAAVREVAHQQPCRETPDLKAHAMQLALKRLVAREAQQKLADDALLQNCPPSSLLQIPLWADNLAPGVPHPLQGTLCVPAQCSVRLLRRVFARAIQIQPHCIQLSHPGGGSVLEDFIAGQEASIEQHGLQAQAAGKGLQVQLRLEQGSAYVQALIHQEADLVRQELLSTRLTTPAAANAAESSGGGDRSPAGRAVKAVLQSAGWGTTSPAKRVPKALPSEAVGRQLADYEALLPAELDEQASAPVISPERRRLGRWTQQEVESLIRKMEAAHHWCQIRDEWPRLGFPRRSAVDLKDKWRNLEGVVLHGKATRTVQLTEEQKERIHRCYRKYRMMQPASSPVASHSSAQKQTQVIEESSPAKRHKSASNSYAPSDEQKSSSTSGSPMKDIAAVVTPMTTRSRARASLQRQSSKSPAQNMLWAAALGVPHNDC
ncbi:TPA: hypothetical protein ACH3X1_012753 [Trebouxia sp. C0004]